MQLKNVQKLTELEQQVWAYINSLPSTVFEALTIRQLAEACHVSKSSILRMCQKLGFDGYEALKYDVAEQAHQQEKAYVQSSLKDLSMYAEHFASPEFLVAQEKAVDLLIVSRAIFFIGIGNSGAMAQYADRYFSNLGFLTFASVDPYRNMGNQLQQGTVTAVILSVSGETDHVIDQTMQLQRLGVCTIAITSNAESKLAHIANVTLTYPVTYQRRDYYDFDYTSQVPVVLALEQLALSTKKRLDA